MAAEQRWPQQTTWRRLSEWFPHCKERMVSQSPPPSTLTIAAAAAAMWCWGAEIGWTDPGITYTSTTALVSLACRVRWFRTLYDYLRQLN